MISTNLRGAGLMGCFFALWACEEGATPSEFDGTGGSGVAGTGMGGSTAGSGVGGDGVAGSGVAGDGMGGSGTAGGGMGGMGATDAGARVINITPARFFPEGVTVDNAGNFYIGSMEDGAIHKATADGGESMPFIAAGAGELVSTLGLYADDATQTLWVCSSDAGNNARTGMAPVALKAFNLADGTPKGSWAWPAPTTNPPITDMAANPAMVNGFCNDITLDAAGNLYATDSWYPRILRLAAGATETDMLEEWVNSDVFPADQWHLNGIDVDQATGNLYVVENHPGALYRIPIMPDGSPGTVTPITTSAALAGPDGLKVVAPNLLVTAEGNGVSLVEVDVAANTGAVTPVHTGFDGYATLALFQASAWVVENQGDHFWDAMNAGPDATPPFRLVEVPLSVGAGAGVVEIATERFFPEGVTVDAAGAFYVGSMDLGTIQKVAAGGTTGADFIAPDETNQLVSVLGLYAHDASMTLWVCNSDAGNAMRSGMGPVALKSFNLADGMLTGSWDFPAPAMPHATAPEGINGFCNDITVGPDGTVYVTDSWYPRILSLPPGAMATDMLAEWVTDDTFGTDQWHLNGIDIDEAGENLYVVENHPGHLWRVTIQMDGTAGMVTEIMTSRPLRNPDGLKVIGPNLLAVAEGGPGGMAIVELEGDSGSVRTVSTGLDGVATFAMLGGSAWLVENQGDHFWGPTNPNGPNANKPFRLVEVPLALPAVTAR